MNELQSSLNQYLEEQEQTERETFVVDTDEKANWALRKIKQAQQKQEEANTLATEEQDKIEAWYQSEREKAQRDIDYFQGLLAYYAVKKREEDPKFKSQKLPNGRIKFVKKQPKLNYDDKTVIEYLKNNERTDLIRVKEEPSKADVKKAFVINEDKLIDPETGEVVDGITVEHLEDEFKVEVDKE
ncbi:host-nuclease inhibitor Gam family protein [Oceanobacillus oncorhynchi subsp. oncorhynchi]|uniref:host-nuclease inhibitor Gam family protein n=1 Tax=Oceanobacillus oncorhynchi TaxID=545501 RepID=UPI0036417301